MSKPTKPVEQEPRIGVYVCHCGLNIAQTVDCRKVADDVAGAEGVVVSKDIVYACSEPGQQQIKQDILDNGLDRVVIASCSPRLHEATFKKMIDSVGLNPSMLDSKTVPSTCQIESAKFRLGETLTFNVCPLFPQATKLCTCNLPAGMVALAVRLDVFGANDSRCGMLR